MANLKASKKDIRINRRNRSKNMQFKTRMKSSLKNAYVTIDENQSDKADKVKEALRIIDKTVAKGVVTKKTAARKKSRLAKALNKSKNAPEKAVTPKKAPGKPTTKVKAPPTKEDSKVKKETEIKTEEVKAEKKEEKETATEKA